MGALKPVTGQEQEPNFRMQLEVNNTCRRWHPLNTETARYLGPETPPPCKMRGAHRSLLPVVVGTGVVLLACVDDGCIALQPQAGI